MIEVFIILLAGACFIVSSVTDGVSFNILSATLFIVGIADVIRHYYCGEPPVYPAENVDQITLVQVEPS